MEWCSTARDNGVSHMTGLYLRVLPGAVLYNARLRM